MDSTITHLILTVTRRLTGSFLQSCLFGKDSGVTPIWVKSDSSGSFVAHVRFKSAVKGKDHLFIVGEITAPAEYRGSALVIPVPYNKPSTWDDTVAVIPLMDHDNINFALLEGDTLRLLESLPKSSNKAPA